MRLSVVMIAWLIGTLSANLVATSYQLQEAPSGFELGMLYGVTHITEPVLVDLIKHSAFERLKEINQYGVMHYMSNAPSYCYTRYEHSLGVFLILRIAGASLEEQIAGLLHDVSHTVFSHVGDLVFNDSLRTKSHQDTVHTWFLKKSGLAEVLATHGFDRIYQVDKEAWPMLSQPTSCLCADRIEYNLKGGLLEGWISEREVQRVMQDLQYQSGSWYFTTLESARVFGLLSLALTEHIWCADWNLFIYHQAAQALRYACAIDLITADDIHFSTDEQVWQKLCASNDVSIKNCIRCITHHTHFYRCGCKQDHDIHLSNRFRGIDPKVMLHEQMYCLSEIDAVFAREFNRVKQSAQAGCYLKFVFEAQKK